MLGATAQPLNIRALGRHEAGKSGGNLDNKTHTLAVGPALNDAGDRVHMAVDQMAAKLIAEAQ